MNSIFVPRAHATPSDRAVCISSKCDGWSIMIMRNSAGSYISTSPLSTPSFCRTSENGIGASFSDNNGQSIVPKVGSTSSWLTQFQQANCQNQTRYRPRLQSKEKMKEHTCNLILKKIQKLLRKC